MMMANPLRGEVTLRMDGKTRTMRLSLGALAALEAELGEKSLPDLIKRFGEERYKAIDIIHVLQAGLYGAGNADVDLRIAEIEGGAKAAAIAAMALLVRGFGEEEFG